MFQLSGSESIKTGSRALIDDRVHARRECQGRAKHHIARSDIQQQQREMDCRRARTQRHRMF